MLATLGAHGSYVADLRLSLKGQDAQIDGVSADYVVPDGAGDDVAAAAEDAKGDVVIGDVVLAGESDDVRVAVIENVELVPRALAEALRDDADLGRTQIDFATLGVTLTPFVSGATATAAASTFASIFALDLCAGCLVLPPEVCGGEGDNALNPLVCRPEQDTPLFTCVQASDL